MHIELLVELLALSEIRRKLLQLRRKLLSRLQMQLGMQLGLQCELYISSGYARLGSGNVMLLRPRAWCAVGCVCPAETNAGHSEIQELKGRRRARAA